MLKLFYLLLFLSSCKFNVSPYTAKIPELNLNAINLKTIKQNESNDPTSFKIAFISDTHSYYTELQKIVDYINSNGPYDFVVVNGDTTNTGLLDEFLEGKRYFDKIKYPVLVGIGNHDLLSNGKSIYRKIYGETDFSFQYKGHNFIFYNSNNWESNGTVPNMSWVDLSLEKTGKDILVSHVSPDDRDRFSDKKINDWETLVSNSNVPYFFVGHNHQHGVQIFGGATLITIGSPSHNVFVEFIFSSGALSYNKVNI